jgi:REP element-mobilizing transposase RayT
MHKHLKRLDQVYIKGAIVFVTACTADRRRELANDNLHQICNEVWRKAEDLYGWLVRRYVLMPDHVHFFCAPFRDECPVEHFVGKWKEWTAKYAHRRHATVVPLWQPEFFDHVLRACDSYDEKWQYVRNNPIRAGLVASAEEWPYQGELHQLKY